MSHTTMGVLIGVVFLFLGVLLGVGRVAPNPLVGVITRWTLADDEVWRKANRFCGLLLCVWGGLLCLARDRYDHLLFAVLTPAIPFFAASTLYAMWVYRDLRGTLVVEARETNPTAGGAGPSWFLDLVPLVLVVVAFAVTRFGSAIVPRIVPTHFDLFGYAQRWGAASGLVVLHAVAVVLYGALTVYGRSVRHRFGARGAWSLFVTKALAVLLLESLVLASILVARGVVSSAWYVTVLPVALLLGYIGYFVARPARAAPSADEAEEAPAD